MTRMVFGFLDGKTVHEEDFIVVAGDDVVGSFRTPLGRKRLVLKAQRLHPTATLRIMRRQSTSTYGYYEDIT